MNFLKMVLVFTMLLACVFEKTSYADALPLGTSSDFSINSSDLSNHCSSHDSDCSSTDTECNICHSTHCVYIEKAFVSVHFLEINQVPLLKELKLYYFSYLSILLRPPIS